MTNRSIYEVGEEAILFINEFLIDQCLQIDPQLHIETLGKSGRLQAIQLENEQFQYFFDNTPLMLLDLKLVLDGV